MIKRAQSLEHAASPAPDASAPIARSLNPAAARAALNDNRAADVRLDQYYTRPEVAARLYATFMELFDPHLFQMVEPSAGTGSFFRLLPPGSIGIDIEPKFPGIRNKDFLKTSIKADRELAYIGNPPFGRNSSLAVRFFNHAALHAEVIAFVVPKTFRKAWLINRLNTVFHLLHEEPMPDKAFTFRSKPYHVPTVFQIWQRGQKPRSRIAVQLHHRHFEFTTKDRANFVIQRVGARAGRVHHDFSRSDSSHYFIRGDVEHIMAQLDFASVVGNTAGKPSLAKSEIVALYRAWIGE